MYNMPGTETVDTQAKAAAEACKNAINAIGTVTMESGGAIGAARGAYDTLTESAKGCVDNYQVLVNAETEYAKIMEKAEKEAKRREQEQKEAEAKAEAKAVVTQINAIGTVTMDSKDAIVMAEKAYKKLSDMAKKYVTNYDVLVQARQQLDALSEVAE